MGGQPAFDVEWRAQGRRGTRDYSDPWIYLQAWRQALRGSWGDTLEQALHANAADRPDAEELRDRQYALMQWACAQHRRFVEQTRHPKVVLAEIAHNRGDNT